MSSRKSTSKISRRNLKDRNRRSALADGIARLAALLPDKHYATQASILDAACAQLHANRQQRCVECAWRRQKEANLPSVNSSGVYRPIAKANSLVRSETAVTSVSARETHNVTSNFILVLPGPEAKRADAYTQTHNASASTASQTHCCAVEMKSCEQQCDLQPCFEVEQSHYPQKYQSTYAAHSYDLTVQLAPNKVAVPTRSKQRQRTPTNRFSVDFLSKNAQSQMVQFPATTYGGMWLTNERDYRTYYAVSPMSSSQSAAVTSANAFHIDNMLHTTNYESREEPSEWRQYELRQQQYPTCYTYSSALRPQDSFMPNFGFGDNTVQRH